MLSTEKSPKISVFSSLNDSGAKALLYLGNSLFTRGKYYQAFASYNRAIEAVVQKSILQTRLGQVEEPWPEKGYIANHEYRFVYCPIPKVACSSFKRLAVQLSHLENKEEILNLPSRFLHSYVDHSLTFFAHYNDNREAAMQLLKNDDYFKFVIVRNPWDRFASAYLNKFITPKNLKKSTSPGKEVVKNLYGKRGLQPDWDKAITFRQFVEYVVANKDEDIDGHWRPQYLFVNDNKFDFITKLENLTEDFAYIKKRLGITCDLPWSNRSKREKNSSGVQPEKKIRGHYADYDRSQLRKLGQYPKYQEFYTPDLIELVRQRYKQDIETFGYEFAN